MPEAIQPEILSITLDVIFYLLCLIFLVGIYHWHKATAKYKSILKENSTRDDVFEKVLSQITYNAANTEK
ncbi:MAG: hypothetical protein HRT88_05910 [Lentisphaeraceae bacterium]|nr:hypothetical protein [Lentisphaeraceae bacterium]